MTTSSKLPPRARFDRNRIDAGVVCIGEALWDVTPGGRHPGGAPMNVAISLASRGVHTRFVSRVGDDRPGRELVLHMQAAGLRTDYVQIDAEYPTGRVNVDTSNPLSVSYDIVAPSAWDYIDAAAFLDAADAPPRTVVFGSLAARNGTSRDSLMRILAGVECRIFDVNLRPPHDERAVVEPLLEQSDWVKLNEAELARIAAWAGGAGAGDDSLHAVARHYSLDVVCATLGADGATLLYDGRLFRQPGFRVDVVDTIGCGDAFLGTLVAELLTSDDPARSLARACAVGAVVATLPGANPRIDESMIRAVTGA